MLIHQDEPPGDVYVLESGRLGVEIVTPEGTRIRLRTLRPGVVVGEIAMYTGGARTADVVAETPSVVLRLEPRVDRAARSRGAGARRGAAPVARHDAGGAADRHAAGRSALLRLEPREEGTCPSSDGPRGCSPRSPAGVIIGAVEAVLAIAFAAFVFGGFLAAALRTASACTSWRPR